MHRASITAAAFLAALVFSACSDGAPAIAVVKPERRDLTGYLTTNGRLRAPDETALHAATSGRVTELRVEKGAQVRAGDTLLRLADSGELAMLSSAQAKLDAARAELASFERGPTPAEQADLEARLESSRAESARLSAAIDRVKRLIDRQAAAPNELEQLQAEAVVSRFNSKSLEAKLTGPVSEERRKVLRAAVRQAESALKQANERAAALAIRAPMAGAVYSLAVENGDYVRAGDRIARIGSLGRMRAEIFIDEPELGRITEGSRAILAADAYPGASWPCTIEDSALEIVELGTRRVAEVSCIVENPDGRLIPNLTVSVRIESAARDNALSVPRSAVGHDREGAFVWIAAQGKALRRPVVLGLRGPDFVAIADGLKESESVLLPGAAELVEGQPVSLLEEGEND